MLRAAKGFLKDKDPHEIAASANVSFDRNDSAFYLDTLGKTVRVSYPDYEFEEVSSTTGSQNGKSQSGDLRLLGEWHRLVILHYLNHADGTPVGNGQITIGEMKDGLIRGGNFDRQVEVMIRRQLGNCDPEAVKTACERLGGRIVDTKADLCAVFPFLPNCPVTMNVWFADEEMEGSGRLLLDKSADHYLTVEDAVTVGTIILDALFHNLC